MAYGRLGVSAPAVTTNTTVYTVPANCLYAEVNINILNTNTVDTTIQLAVATTGTPNAEEYIEKGVVVPASGGVVEHNNIFASPGERIVVYSSQSGSVVRVHGREITKV